MRLKYFIKNNLFKNKKSMIMTLLLVVISITGLTSYALFTTSIEHNNALNIVTGNLYSLIESDDLVNNTISIEPNSKKEITIKLTNGNSIDAKFNLYYTSTSEDANLYYIDTETPREEGIVLPAYQKVGYQGSYNLIVINNSSTAQTITVNSNVGLSTAPLTFPDGVKLIEVEPTTECKDVTDHGGTPNEPELVGDMIPVVYDGTNWVKADVSTEWYNYNVQEWANAVTVTDTNRATLVSSNPGTVISMEDINAMFVWIPRYSYTIGNTYGVQGCGGSTPSVNTPGAFDIKWIESTTTELGAAAYTGDTVSEWYTNPAFCWGDSCDDSTTRLSPENRELSGIWVGKFETSTTGSVTSNTIREPIITPSVQSWRTVNVSNMFNSVRTYMNGDNGNDIFGLSGLSYDAHMMKNTEWGVVAYLSQSKYGKYGNTTYTGANKEVYQNKHSSFITGNSNGTPGESIAITQCSYNDIIDRGNGIGSCGAGASTTGNITGVYDMSGGAFEYVMGNMEDESGIFYPAYSGFSSVPEARYYNSYAYGSSSSDYTRGMLGDGTKETLGFYQDSKYSVKGSDPWFYRGGYNLFTTGAGVFNFYGGTGDSNKNYSFRVSLVP